MVGRTLGLADLGKLVGPMVGRKLGLADLGILGGQWVMTLDGWQKAWAS